MRVLAVGRAERAPAADDGSPGEVLRVVGVLQDISGPTLARQQISDLTERLHVATEAGGIAVWDWDLDSDRVVLDARMARLLELGAEPAHHVGNEPGNEPGNDPGNEPGDEPGDGPTVVSALVFRRALDAMLAPAESQRLDAALMDAVQTLGPVNIVVCRKRSDADTRTYAATDAGADATKAPERWLHLTGSARAGHLGRAARLVGCAWDSSAEHESARLLAAKDAAEQASRSKSAFLSRMSHELRTPLNAILGFSQLMRVEAEAGDLVLKPHRVVLIETAARHLLDLVNQVLDVSRIESGQLELKLESFTLGEVVGECVPMVQGLADRAGVALRDITDHSTPCTVLADRLRLKEVLINLLSNAIKYNRRGGDVELRAMVYGEGCMLEVVDTGQGLTPAQQTGLFQPFNRLGAEATGIEGSGMGLFVSRRFVELMGGHIEIDSALGVGTTVRVCLNVPLEPEVGWVETG